MKLFTVRLTDDERLKLEAHRIAHGLRSHAEVVRWWIAQPVNLKEDRPNDQADA